MLAAWSGRDSIQTVVELRGLIAPEPIERPTLGKDSHHSAAIERELVRVSQGPSRLAEVR